MTEPPKQRILIIGLDGFTWRIATPLIQQGKLPVLGDLIRQGCSGTLSSIFPPETSPAWSSFQTGCRPDKTGIFAFHGFHRSTQNIRLNSYQDIKVPTMWELFSAAGKTVVSLNMPMTSPPPRVNGIIIPGLTCPKLSSETVHPPEVFERYIASNPDYLIVDNEICPDMTQGVARAVKTENVRCDLALELMRQTHWDLFSVQIQSTDVFQHRCWWALDPEADAFTKQAYEQAVEFYAGIDRIVGRLVEAAGPSALTVIVSDHGFCAKKAEIGINTWLLQNGYLTLGPVRTSPFVRLKEKIKEHVPLAKRLAGCCGPALHSLGAARKATREKKSTLYSEEVVRHIRQTINMERTFAFCLGGMGGLIYLTDRTQKGRADRMIQALLDAYGPASHDPLIADISPVEKLCRNTQDDYPDYLVTFLPGVEGRIAPQGDAVVKAGTLDGKQTGTHEQDGVMIWHGRSVKTNGRSDAEIIDIAPTLLAYLNIAVPDTMDGKVLDAAFIEPPKVCYQPVAPSNRQGTDDSAQKQDLVEKQLRDLGYL